METRRLKNIAILILLLLNGCLLLLLGYQRLQSHRSQQEAVEQLYALFDADQITLSPQADLTQEPLPPLSLTRDTTAESDIAAFLLGAEADFLSQGGGIHSYTADSGALYFRSGGSFDGSALSLPVDDISGFSHSFFRTFDYVPVTEDISGGSGTVIAAQQINGVSIINCPVTLTFQSGLLSAVSGSHVSQANAAAAAEGEQLSCITALVRFLDYCRSSGMISRQVNAISCIYTLESTSASPRLLPSWRIETDTYTYLVDCSDGEVSRQS